MAKFIIHTWRDGGIVRLLYDSSDSSLTYENGKPVIGVSRKPYLDADLSGTKHDMRILKISLGMSCNYSCEYCTQRFMPRNDEDGLNDWKKFVDELPSWFDIKQDKPKIEFWGGEPLVYWKTLKPLAEALRTMMPTASFLMITNGSLLTLEINEWLDKMGFSIGISHDGPGQKYRGPDPLDDPAKLDAIRDLYQRLRPKDKISFNAMLYKGNLSRADIVNWFKERFGKVVPIGEGTLIHAGSDYSVGMSLGGIEEQYTYRRQTFGEIRSGQAVNVMVVRDRIRDFIRSLETARPASSLQQQCHMDWPQNIAIDLKGNVLVCQNVTAKSHKIGDIYQIENVSLDKAAHWSQRKECPQCPVLQLCKGACMMLDGERWDATCRNAFSDNVVFFSAAIESLTGCLPFLIEGQDNGWWIFGDGSVKDGR